jgi:hypothetical protein
VTLAEQVEDADALTEVVVGLGRSAGRGMKAAPQAKELTPRAAHRSRLNSRRGRLELFLGAIDVPGCQERLSQDQLALQHVGSRCLRRARDIRRDGVRRAMLTVPERKPGLEHLQRPLIPAARLGAVFAVRLPGFLQAAAGGIVLAARQMDLRQRVEHRAGRLPHELQRASDVQGAVQCFFRALQVSKPDADLAQGRERDAKTVRRSALLLELHAPLGQAERLIVAVLHQGHVGLVTANGRKHITGLDDHGKPLGLSESGHRLVEATFLGEGDP